MAIDKDKIKYGRTRARKHPVVTLRAVTKYEDRNCVVLCNKDEDKNGMVLFNGQRKYAYNPKKRYYQGKERRSKNEKTRNKLSYNSKSPHHFVANWDQPIKAIDTAMRALQKRQLREIGSHRVGKLPSACIASYRLNSNILRNSEGRSKPIKYFGST